MLELERQLEDADNCDRARLLGGHDPSPAQLKIKLEDVSAGGSHCTNDPAAVSTGI